MLVSNAQLQMLCLTYLSKSISALDESRQNTWCDMLTAPRLTSTQFRALSNALALHAGIYVQSDLDHLMDNLTL